MSAQKYEKMVMKENTDTLIKGLRQAKDEICRKLCGKGLISYSIRQDCLEGKSGIDTIVSALQDRVENDSGAYYEFLKILEDDLGLKYLKDMLEEDRLSKVSQVSTKSALKAEPDSMFEETAQQRRILGSSAFSLQGPRCANSQEVQFEKNPSLSPEEDLPLSADSYYQTKQDTSTTSLVCSGAVVPPLPSTAPITRYYSNSNAATSANTDTALDTCDEGNKTVEENTGKLTAEYRPVKMSRSNSDDSYYSAKNDCNSTEACSTAYLEGKHTESNSCSRCSSLQVEVESLKNKCDDYLAKITELKEENHEKDREIDSLKEKFSVSMRYLKIEEEQKKEEREEKIGERRKYSELLSKEQDSKEKEKVDKESERKEKMKLELEISDLKRFRKEDHQTVGTLPTRIVMSTPEESEPETLNIL